MKADSAGRNRGAHYDDGGEGNDILNGDAGSLLGGAGNDLLWRRRRFRQIAFTQSQFSGDVDTIKDFEDGIDLIVLPVALQGYVTITQSGYGYFLSGGNGWGVVIEVPCRPASPSAATSSSRDLFLTRSSNRRAL